MTNPKLPNLSEVLEKGLDIDGLLSEREQQIVMLAAEGLPDKLIATKLGLTPGTVRTYWVRLRAKTGTQNRAELLSRFLAAAGGVYERERLRLGAELEGLEQAVLLVDHDMCCRGANQSAASMLGQTIEDLLNKSLDELFPSADELPLLVKMRETLRQRQPMTERFHSKLLNTLVDLSGHPTDIGVVFVISRVR